MNALEALNRARRAWEATQPQLQIEGVLDEPGGLEQRPNIGVLEHSHPRFVEPALTPPPVLLSHRRQSPLGAGSQLAAEPNCLHGDLPQTAGNGRAVAPSTPVRRPPISSNGPGRTSYVGLRGQGREGA